MKRAILGLIAALCMSGTVLAGEIKMVDDAALAEVSAQGFNLNFQTIDSVINSNNSYRIVSNLPRELSMVDSMMISGAAQQNAFVPVNAVNSAVNVPINIVIVMDSQISGGININNILDAALR